DLENKQGWTAVYQALNLPLIYEFSDELIYPQIEKYVTMARIPKPPTPVCAEQALARKKKYIRESRSHWEYIPDKNFDKGMENIKRIKLEIQNQLQEELRLRKEKAQKLKEKKKREGEQLSLKL
ncbi:MAG: hypothetical protein WCI23_12780, partial [Chlorobiaceae bacterium]